jgi:flavin-dependent dehydrogenase
MYDVIVVGARCAGSPTAMLLARQGYRVLLVDRATFPSDTVPGHFIHQPGVANLERWGLLEQIVRSNCPPVTHATFDLGPFALTGSPPAVDGVAAAYGPRRTVLDKILVDAATEAGVEVREGFAVQEVVRDGERVVGIRGRGRAGPTVTEVATIVVGADGRHSLVARAVGAAEYRAVPALTCTYYGYWSGVPIDGLELHLRDRRMVGAFPTNDSLVCVFVTLPRRELGAFRADVEGSYLAGVDVAPGLAERIRGGRRVERIAGTADVGNLFRKPYGPGWALVGDAGYHLDPITGQGITDAFRDSGLLAAAINAGLSGEQPIDLALADYERRRNEAALPAYDLACELATLEPPTPERQRYFSSLRGNQVETDRLFGAIAGTVPVEEVFALANVERVIASAESVVAPMA